MLSFCPGLTTRHPTNLDGPEGQRRGGWRPIKLKPVAGGTLQGKALSVHTAHIVCGVLNPLQRPTSRREGESAVQAGSAWEGSAE